MDAIVIVATFIPNAVVAVNCAETVAVCPAGTEKLVGWPEARANWFGFVPPMVTFETKRSLAPVFVMVTDLGGVGAPRGVLKTSREVSPRTSSAEVTLMVGEPAAAVMVKLDEALPVLPAPSVAVTTTVWLPAVLTVIDPV